MPIGPTIYFGKDRIFVDREACIRAFMENIKKSGTQEYNVLFFHGIAGIGKSELQKELQRMLNEEYPEIIWVSIDLSIKTYREIGTFLITLRNKIQEKCKAKFYLFNIIHAIYWKRLHPEIPLQKDNYPLIKEGGFFSKIIDIIDEFGPARLTWDIINNAPDNIKRFFIEQAVDIHKLTVMDTHELEKLLPGFFAADFISYLGTNSKAYIFIDTYEAFWEGLRDKGSFHEKDEWIRDNLIPNKLHVSWVICGREKLLWASECDPDWKMYLDQYQLEGLTENYCIEFLEKCGIENKDIIDVIIKSSEGVPYYLNLSLDTFEKINRSKKPVPEYFGKTQLEIFNTFVKYLNTSEIRALEVLSAPNFWDRNLFKILMKKFDSGLPTSAFSELIQFSFIKKDTDEKYSIHQLMRQSLQEHQNSVDRKNVHKFMFEYYNNKINDLDIRKITSDRENALAEAFYHATKVLEKTKDLINWFIAASNPFNRAAFWQLLIPMYEEMLQILKTKLEPEHSDIATILNNLALLYYHLGAYDKADSLYQRALEIYEKVFGAQHPEVATTLNNLAGLYYYTGAYDKALPLYLRALDVRENNLGPQHPSVAATLNNLALLYDSMGDYDKSLLLYQRALDISENTLGHQNLDVGTSLNNLALLYDNTGSYDKALPLYQRALDIREKILGPQHPDVSQTLNNLALLYYHTGSYDKALLLYQRALDIHEKVFGSQHPEVATTLNNLALLYDSTESYDKALPLYLRALDIREKTLGSQHPDVTNSLNNLATLYSHMGSYDKALSHCKRALDILEKVLGPQHPDVANSLNNLAAFHSHMGSYDKALLHCKRALGIYEKVLGPQNPDFAITLNNIAFIYLQMGDPDKALSHCKRALEILENVLGPQHPSVKNTMNNLVAIYHHMGSYDKALQAYRRI